MKKIFVLSAYCLAILIVLYSCHPAAIRKSRMAERSTEVDSVLYYPAKEIKDPFLDSLKADVDKPVRIRAILYPDQKEKPKHRKAEGFRVQVFAAADSLNARTLENSLNQITQDSVYFIKENSLFKIQLGDFLYRNDADMRVLDLRKENYPGAWVVKTTINVPQDTLAEIADTSKTKENIPRPFKIQVFVTSDEIRAKTVVQQVSDQLSVEGFYEQSDMLFKVYAGQYQTRAEAEEKLNLVRSNGWPDAWISSAEE